MVASSKCGEAGTHPTLITPPLAFTEQRMDPDAMSHTLTELSVAPVATHGWTVLKDALHGSRQNYDTYEVVHITLEHNPH